MSEDTSKSEHKITDDELDRIRDNAMARGIALGFAITAITFLIAFYLAS